MEQFEKNIRQHHLNRQLQIGRMFTDFLEKGKVAQEGEVREWNGKKYQKTNGKWVELSGNKRPEKKKAPGSNKKKKKEDNSPNNPPKDVASGVGSEEKAKLAIIKRMYKEDPVAAHQMAEGLSDEAKSVIPEKVWIDMIEGSVGRESDEEKVSVQSIEDTIRDSEPGSPEYEDAIDKYIQLSQDEKDEMDYDIEYDASTAVRKRKIKAKRERRQQKLAKLTAGETTRDVSDWESWRDSIKINSKEKEAVNMYQGNEFYEEVNSALRYGEQVSSANKKTVSEINSAIDKNSISEDVIVYRGIG